MKRILIGRGSDVEWRIAARIHSSAWPLFDDSKEFGANIREMVDKGAKVTVTKRDDDGILVLVEGEMGARDYACQHVWCDSRCKESIRLPFEMRPKKARPSTWWWRW